MTNNHDRVLGIHPTRTGFGWVLFEGPQSHIDWGVVVTSGDRSAECLRRIDALMDDFKPADLVLETFEGPALRRAGWVQQFCRNALDLANAKNVDAFVYTRQEIAARFEEIGAASRYEIASAIASSIEPLAHELPPKRKIWLPENPRMGVLTPPP